MLTVRVLGPVELLRAGLPQPLDRIQVRRLLSLLVSTPGRRWAVDELVDELWPDRLPANPHGALQTVVARLRDAIGRDSDVLVRHGATYTIDLPTDAVDAWQLAAAVADARGLADPTSALRRLDGALALWRGVPFVDTPGPPALDHHAARFAALRSEAETLRAIAAVRAGVVHRAVASGVPYVLAHPTDEVLGRVVAGALALQGRRTDALDLLQTVRSALADELGVEPDRALVATERAIRDGEAPLPELVDARPAAVRGDVVVEQPPVAALVGRQVPLQALVDAMPSAAGAPGRLVLVGGDAGIGKTALLASLTNELAARDDVTIVRAEFVPPDDDAPWLALADRVRATGDATVEARAVLDHLEARLDHPLVVVLDDVQWAGPVTLATLRMFARRPSAGITIVAAHRPPEPDAAAAFAETLAALLAQFGVQSIALAPLDADALAELPQLRRLPPMQRHRAGTLLLRLTAGNAFLATTLVEHAATGLLDLDDELPAVLAHSLTARLAPLSPGTRRVLEIAAIDPAGMDVHVLGALAGIAPNDLATALREARRIGVVRDMRDDRVRFDHDLTRLGLRARLDDYEVRTLHARAARLIAAGPEHAIERALHAAAAGTTVADTEAVPLLVHGAQEALSTGRFEIAAQLFAEVTGREHDFELRLRHAVALEAAGRRGRALVLYDQLLAEALAADDTTAAARAALGGALHGGTVGGDPERIGRLERSLEHPPADDALHLRVLAALVRELAIADLAIPATVVKRAKRLLTDDETGAAMHAAIDAVTLAAVPVTPQAVTKARRLATTGARSGERELVLRGLELYTILQLSSAGYDDALDALAELVDAVDSFPLPRYRWSVALLGALTVDLREGYEAADPAMREAWALGSDLEIPDALNAYSMFLLSAGLRRGNLDQLEPAVAAAVNGPRCIPAWHAVHAATLAHCEESDRARAGLERFRAEAAGARLRFPDVAYAFAAETAIVLDDHDWCEWIAQQIGPWSGRLILAGAGAGCYGPTDLVIARLRAHIGDDAGAKEALDAARDAVRSPHAAAWRTIVDAFTDSRH